MNTERKAHRALSIKYRAALRKLAKLQPDITPDGDKRWREQSRVVSDLKDRLMWSERGEVGNPS
jgi:hypothetical protein